MKSINPNADYLNLLDATILDSTNEFKNDLGQRIKFFEDPTLGEDGCVWVAFPDYSVAFRSDFYDLDDMTAKVGDVFSAEVCITNGWSIDEDMDYVPRLINGKMVLKGDEEITPEGARELLDRLRKDLDTLIALGESYAHFQSAQATHKYLKKAKNALKGLS